MNITKDLFDGNKIDIKNQKLLFLKIFMEKKLKNKKSFKKRSLTINTNNFNERNNKKINELHINSNNYYINNDLKIFKDYKSNYLTKMNSLITENKKISKSLSGFIKNNLEI